MLADPPAAGEVPRVRAATRERQLPFERGGGQHLVRHVVGHQLVQLALDQPGVQPSGADVHIGQQRAQERDVRGDAEQHGPAERGVQLAQRLLAGAAVRDHLRQHGVVVAADPQPHLERRVDPHVVRLVQRQHLATGRQEPAGRVLGVDARLDRVPGERDLGEVQRFAAGHPELPLDQVDAGDQLGDRVLDLEAGVHLHEEVVAGRAVDDELHRARAEVADGLRGVHRRPPHRRAGLRVEQRGRRLLDDLLVPPLEAALALAEVHGAAVRVGQHLDLDVPRVGDEPLDEQRLSLIHIAACPCRHRPRTA